MSEDQETANAVEEFLNNPDFNIIELDQAFNPFDPKYKVNVEEVNYEVTEIKEEYRVRVRLSEKVLVPITFTVFPGEVGFRHHNVLTPFDPRGYTLTEEDENPQERAEKLLDIYGHLENDQTQGFHPDALDSCLAAEVELKQAKKTGAVFEDIWKLKLFLKFPLGQIFEGVPAIDEKRALTTDRYEISQFHTAGRPPLPAIDKSVEADFFENKFVFDKGLLLGIKKGVDKIEDIQAVISSNPNPPGELTGIQEISV